VLTLFRDSTRRDQLVQTDAGEGGTGAMPIVGTPMRFLMREAQNRGLG
jgi:protein subunit release factor B